MDNLGASLSPVFSSLSPDCLHLQIPDHIQFLSKIEGCIVTDFVTSELYGKVHTVPFDCLQWSWCCTLEVFFNKYQFYNDVLFIKLYF